MEDLKRQRQIINLGKLLVKELGIENSVDTLSRWVAHYVAEKITLIESLPAGKKKGNAQKECFEIILKLWENRWKLPAGKRPLESFEPILNVLKRINPEEENPFFYSLRNRNLETDNIAGFDEIDQYLETIQQIDKVARIWIDFLLQQATLAAKDEYTEVILNNVLSTSNNHDIDTIKLLFDNIEESTKKNMRDSLQKRIKELEKFSKLNELILNEYRKDCSNLE